MSLQLAQIVFFSGILKTRILYFFDGAYICLITGLLAGICIYCQECLCQRIVAVLLIWPKRLFFILMVQVMKLITGTLASLDQACIREMKCVGNDVSIFVRAISAVSLLFVLPVFHHQDFNFPLC